jgi:hypothetical protein
LLNFEIGFLKDLAGRETQIRELIDNEFNQVIFAVDTQGYTKQDKTEVMKNIIADIEKCIGIIEKDENARLSEV